MNAPKFDPARENRNRNLLIGAGVLVVLMVLTGLGGIIAGHGWFFTNLRAEHRVSTFFDALEAKDYNKAYAIWNNDADWQQHPQKYDYTLKRFTEDWATQDPIRGPVNSYHVDISKTDGSGTFGTGIIVAVRVNGNNKVFMYYLKADGTLEWPAPHLLEY